ncbi:hypothetical protein EBT16_14290, partial [bacterium]|nr:hypothetical protein [bacterium]
LLTQSGIYLISRNKNISASLNDFLVITLHSPSSSTTALILKNSAEHQADFLNQLDTIYKKYSSLEDVDPNLIQCKVFGTGNKFTPFLATLKLWLNKNGIPVIATDLGRPFPGELVLEGASGRVRIKYQVGTEETPSSILSTGTARNRAQSQATTEPVLVLSRSQVIRTLSRQAIEEDPQWEASCPDKLDSTSLSLFLKKNHWSAVIVSNELKSDSKLMDQILDFATNHPKVCMAWIGAELPDLKKESKRFRLLPPLEPVLIPHFKKILKQSIQASTLSETSETLSFPKRKAKS